MLHHHRLICIHIWPTLATLVTLGRGGGGTLGLVSCKPHQHQTTDCYPQIETAIVCCYISRENNNSMDVIHFRWVHLYPCSPAVMCARAGTRRGGLAAAQLTTDSSPVLGKIMDVLSVE